MSKNQYIKGLHTFVRKYYGLLNTGLHSCFIKKVLIRSIDTSIEIPKKIYQMFPDISLPQEIKENIEGLKKRNPNWEYTLYDDEMAFEYIANHFPELVTFYQSINPKYGAARADLFRYILMYNEGGCYLDIKSTFIVPLDTLMDSSGGMILSYWENKQGEAFENWGVFPELRNPNGEFMQSFIIAPKGHPYLKAVIEHVVKEIQSYSRIVHGAGLNGVVRLTGPVAFSKAIEPIVMLYPHRLVNIKKLGYVYSIYSDRHLHRKLFKSHYSELKDPIISQ